MTPKPGPRPEAAVDWGAIEREFRAGQLSIREIARAHNISDTAIRKRARRDGWKQDLVGRVGVEIERKLLEADAGVERGTKVPDQVIVERAAERAADVVLGHRGRLVRLRERIDRLETAYDAVARDIKADVEGFLSASAALNRLIDLTSQIIGLERQAYGIDKGAGAGGGEDRQKLSADQRAAVLKNIRARVLGPEAVTT